MNVIVRQPGSLPSFAIQEMAEGARFENHEVLETKGCACRRRQDEYQRGGEVWTGAMGVESNSSKNLYRAWRGVESSNDLIQGFTLRDVRRSCTRSSRSCC